MQPENTNQDANVELSGEEAARRDFLKKAGRYALVTPPAVTALLSTSMNSSAVAASGGLTTRPGNGFGSNNHIHTGPRGPSNNSPSAPPGQAKK
jgi:hypothetical protein